MLYRPNLRNSIHKTENEEIIRRKLHEQKLQEKKELLRAEFHALELEQGIEIDEEHQNTINETKVIN